MTEQQWLTSTCLSEMQSFLWGKISDRKLRLFGCACVRRVWHLLEEPARRLVEAGECLADATVTKKDLAAVKKAVRRLRMTTALQAACNTLKGRAWDAASDAAWMARSAEVLQPPWPTANHTDAGIIYQYQCGLLRDMVGNPFRAVMVDPAWLAWNDGAVAKIGQVIYDSRCFEQMPILADALEEAGCTDADMLAHCRNPGEHARGCWIVDLVLGRV